MKNTNKKLSLLVVGGSQGAQIFNNNLKYSIVNLSKIIQLKKIQQTNEKKYSFEKAFTKKIILKMKYLISTKI